ncbi:MAG TPA: ROK family transcriptional regulator [Solirubrobacteraceae bacterium]|nr:ROK family transcriptional regulator [Solirubrobacteraceae bacterium]
MNEIPEPPSRAGEVLRAVHRSPGIPRAELAARAGLSSGLASDLVARLVGEGWLSEGEPAAAAGRGRPTRTLWPHPDGPLVAAVAISHETWRIELCELGGGVVECAHAAHERRCEPVCRAVAGALEAMWRTHGPRIHAIAVSAPGIVSGTRLVQAPNLGWEDVELAALRPSEAVAAGIGFHAGNDANDSAVAELARGAAEGLSGALVVFMDSGVGGALIDCGRVTQGAHGMSGEFGHLPLGSRRVRCRCGAAGCWNTELDGAAVARLLGRSLPADEVSFTRRVLAAARDGGREEMRAARAIARALGRGTAGLVNACDPERVVFCGLATALLSVAPGVVDQAYRAALMSTRAAAPPQIVAGLLGDRAPLVGAMEAAFAPVLAHPAL